MVAHVLVGGERDALERAVAPSARRHRVDVLKERAHGQVVLQPLLARLYRRLQLAGDPLAVHRFVEADGEREGRGRIGIGEQLGGRQRVKTQVIGHGGPVEHTRNGGRGDPGALRNVVSRGRHEPVIGYDFVM